jgi:hypothetical protein
METGQTLLPTVRLCSSSRPGLNAPCPHGKRPVRRGDRARGHLKSPLFGKTERKVRRDLPTYLSFAAKAKDRHVAFHQPVGIDLFVVLVMDQIAEAPVLCLLNYQEN